MTNDFLGLLPDEWLQLESVSGGDAAGSVSGGDAGAGTNNYYINFYTVPETLQPEKQYTLWDKPLEEYSVSEGLLLILVIAAVAVLIWNIIKGGFKWLT